MTNNELENDEAEAGSSCEADVEEPEVCRRHRLVKASDPADKAIAEEEGQVIEADDGGVDRLGRVLGEEGEADRQEMGEGDAVDNVESDRPEEPDFMARSSESRRR